MLKDGVMEWKGSLKETYFHYLWPNRLRYDDNLWKNIANNEINSLWQLSTDVGFSSIGKYSCHFFKRNRYDQLFNAFNAAE